MPQNQLPLISRTINLEYLSIICRDAFDITTPPNTDAINKFGGYDITAHRLAIIGGEIDSWRIASPLAPQAQPWHRPNNTDQSFFIIDDGGHQWDGKGLFPNETTPTLPPAPVALAQSKEHDFVGAWLKEAEGHFP